MSFTKLRDRLETLPLVLAGPIVRRVEPAGVTIWVALRRRRRIRLEIYDGNPPQGQIVANGAADTLPVGTNLHIACVTAKPTALFTAGTTYQYNLFFDHLGGGDDIQNGADLFGPRIVSASSLEVLAQAEAHNALAYGADGGPPRPSFVLPPSSLDQLRLLHGSCRKISGPHNDALEAADHILRDAFRTNGRRPHMLFLTGDNIYNDGCAPASFEVILEAAPVLLGWDESILMADPNLVVTFSSLSDPRWDFSLDDAGLSSPGADLRQLFGLGECLALHLLTFADVLWPEDLDYQRHTFDFRGSLPAVRRALANVATYMTFDDHEFSNSWNLTADWVESVLEKPLGRRIYQNALAAYALCQGWGNTPEQFETGAGKTLLDAIVGWSQAEIGGTASPAQPLAQISKSTGLPDVDAFRNVRDWSGFHGPDVVRWYYSVPCPSLKIEVLDAYMWRAYEGKTTNAIILSDAALNEQIQQPQPDAECALIVVSNVAIDLPSRGGFFEHVDLIATRVVSYMFLPLWVLGRIVVWILSIFTSVPSSLPSLFALLRASLYEPEYGSSYEHQTKGFELLMSHALHRAPQQVVGGKRQSRVVFISGDAHKSFCMRMEYWSRIPFNVSGEPVEGVLAQLVGSPCKWVNPTKYKVADFDIHWAGWRDEPALTWTTEPDKSPWRFKKSPWMMNYDPTASEPRMNPEPEWRYALESIPPNASTTQPLEIPDRPNPTLEDRLAEMELVKNGLLGHFAKSQVLKVNNLADVTFDWTSGAKTVTQQVWWRGQPSVVPEWTISRFDIFMEPPPSPPPLPQ